MVDETSQGTDKVLPPGAVDAEERMIAATEVSTAAGIQPSTDPSTSEDANLLIRAELAAKFEQLATRARAVGLSPLQEMAKTYAKRAMSVLDSLLIALEEVPKKTPDEREKRV